MPQASANTPVGETREKIKRARGKPLFKEEYRVENSILVAFESSSKSLLFQKRAYLDALDHHQLRVAKLAPVNAPF